MKITFHGNSNFVFTGKKSSLSFNPENEASQDLVLLDNQDSNYKSSSSKVINWPGEYEISGIPIIGIKSPTSQSVVYRFNIDEVSICIITGVKDKFSDEILEKIGDIDVLILNIGGEANYEPSKAHDAFEDIEPRLVIAFGSQEGINVFAKNFGAQPKIADNLEVSRASLPTESTDFYVLNAV